jgi:hypothetical protein
MLRMKRSGIEPNEEDAPSSLSVLRGTESSNLSPSAGEAVSRGEPALAGRESRVFARVHAAELAAVVEIRRVRRYRANLRCYLCRTMFQYRGAADVVGDNGGPGPSSALVPSSGLCYAGGSLNSDSLKQSRARLRCSFEGRPHRSLPPGHPHTPTRGARSYRSHLSSGGRHRNQLFGSSSGCTGSYWR